MAKIKQLKDKSGTEQIFPKTKTQAIYNTDGTLLSETLDDLYGSLATIESSPTTTSHSVGEYILYEGQVYRVTSVIASGDSLVVGTNISAVNLGNQISTLNSKLTNTAISGSDVVTLASGISAVSIECYKNDYIIDLRVACKKTDGSAFSGRINPLFTINSGYRPKMAFGVVSVTNSLVSGFMTGYCCAYFTTAGTVIVDTITTNQKQIDIHVCYLL